MKRLRGTMALGLAMVMVACGGGDATTTDGASSEAVLGIYDADVEVAPGNTDFAVGVDGQGLDLGDGVRTDDSGFAEIAYFDGSLTRLDIDSSIVITRLATVAEAADIEVRLDIGRAWHRINRDINSEYAVELPVGTAAVRGTAFITDCRNEGCLVIVFEGTVEITTISGDVVTVNAGQQVQIADDGTPGEIEDIPAAAFNDPWIADNMGRDVEQEFAPLGPGAGGSAVGLPSTDDPPTDPNGDAIEPGTIVAIDNDTSQFAIVHMDGRVVPLDTGASSVGTPRWSPDGRLIAFHADGTGDTSDIFVIRPDGTGLTAITTTADDYEQSPVWAASQYVAYTIGGRIGRLDLTSGATSVIFDGNTIISSMDWAWTGDRMIAVAPGDVVHWLDADGAEQFVWEEGGGGSVNWMRWLPDGFGLSVETNDAYATKQIARVVEPGGGNPFQFSGQLVRADWIDGQRHVYRSSGTLLLGEVGVGSNQIADGSFNSPDAWIPPQN